MNTLYLAWQAPTPSRAWFPVGRLDSDPRRHKYCFQYTHGALQAQRQVGFSPLMAFPQFKERYESSELFPLFKNRVLDSHRKDFADYLTSLDLKPGHTDPIEILAITGGERQTDSLEVFPKIEKSRDGSFSCRFFVHGLRYMPEHARSRAMTLRPGQQLSVLVELTNPKTQTAILLATDDYHFIGWTPRYLVDDLLKAIAETEDLAATVVRVNDSPIPSNRRLLVEMRGKLPAEYEPMSTKPFQIIGARKSRKR